MADVLIRYWAAAREAAGTAEEGCVADTLADALTLVRERHRDRPSLAAVLDRSSFLVSGEPVGHRDHHAVRLAGGDVVEVLPPFAGG